MFGFPLWPQFHKQWTAVRTRFIDDRVEEHAPNLTQLVNLGAGMDTRPNRMPAYAAFARSMEVDMEVVNTSKAKIFSKFLSSPTSHCPVENVDLDFLDKEKSLASELGQRGFDATVPSLFLSEGLIMYLGAEGKVKLLGDVSAVAAVGSVLVLQFMDATGSDAAKENPAVLNSALSQEEARKELGERGWGDFQFFAFGDDALNFGRFQGDKPSLSFSFCVCKKLSKGEK